MTPKEIAIKMVKPYAQRGDDPEWFRKSLHGEGCTEYSAGIGGYMNVGENDDYRGKKIPNTKIIVHRIGEKRVNAVFNFYEIWELAKQKKTKIQDSLFS